MSAAQSDIEQVSTHKVQVDGSHFTLVIPHGSGADDVKDTRVNKLLHLAASYPDSTAQETHALEPLAWPEQQLVSPTLNPKS